MSDPGDEAFDHDDYPEGFGVDAPLPGHTKLVASLRDGLCVEEQRCRVRNAESGCHCAKIADYIERLAKDRNASINAELRAHDALAALKAERASPLRAMNAILHAVMRQAESDLASAHAEICKLQNLDPAKHEWPKWSPQANTLRWFDAIRQEFPSPPDPGRPVPHHGSGP